MTDNIRVLIVEDNRDDYTLTFQMLANIPGRPYEMDWTTNAEDALEAMESKAYDVCLVDYYLGQTTGVDLIQRASNRGISVPMIILTGQDSAAADFAAQKVGAVDFLVKNDLTGRALDRSMRYVMERMEMINSLRNSRSFFESILDSIAANVAIIDESGGINRVNRQWRKFAESNGLRNCVWENVNYLAACDASAKAGDASAGEIGQAIRDVLAQRWNRFTAEYPCHSPGEQRWFRVAITRFQHLRSSWAVVAHYDITEWKKTGAAG